MVDGLGSDGLDPSTTPNLSRLAENAAFWRRGSAVLPTVTNANHASIVTGVHPAGHGIVGNQTVGADGWRESLDRGELVEVETFFEELARSRPEARTVLVAGKAKIGGLLGSGASVSWTDPVLEEEAPDLAALFATDERVAAAAVKTFESDVPTFALVCLSGVDLASHVFGPGSAEAEAARRLADRLVGDLLDWLARRRSWKETIVVVTSDHGFAEASADPIVKLGSRLADAGFPDAVSVSNGGTAFVHLRAEARPDDLRRARDAVLGPGVADAYVRNGTVAPGLPSDWKLDHRRAGDLVVVAEPGFFFGDSTGERALRFLGNHGGPDVRDIPIWIAGGSPILRRVSLASSPPPDNADLGATIRRLLGLPEPRAHDGEPISPALRGRVLEEAFLP